MSTLARGLQYLLAAVTGLIIAFLATGLVSYAIFPSDGPIGEGIIMLMMYLLFACVCVPGYVFLMDLHVKGRTDRGKLVAREGFLRGSVIVGACLLCFIIVMLPTAIATKWIASFLGVVACAWAIRPSILELGSR